MQIINVRDIKYMILKDCKELEQEKENRVVEIVIPSLGGTSQIKLEMDDKLGSIVEKFPYTIYLNENKAIIRDDFVPPPGFDKRNRLTISKILISFKSIWVENNKSTENKNNNFGYRLYYRIINLPF